MKILFSIPFITALILFAGFISAQNIQKDNRETGSLKIVVNGCNNDKGTVNVSLCNSKETYSNEFDKGFQSINQIIKDGKAECIFKDISYGSYAVKVLHDENDNKKLDRKIFGIPKEQYGFSNNAWATFGLPDYEEALFPFNKAEMTINITVRFWEGKEQK